MLRRSCRKRAREYIPGQYAYDNDVKISRIEGNPKLVYDVLCIIGNMLLHTHFPSFVKLKNTCKTLRNRLTQDVWSIPDSFYSHRCKLPEEIDYISYVKHFTCSMYTEDSHLQKLTNLRSLDFGDNLHCERLPPSINNICWLKMGWNARLSSSYISQLTRLTLLNCNNVDVTDDDIHTLIHLRSLNLGNSFACSDWGLYDKIYLKELWLGRCRDVTDESIVNLINLTLLDLGRCNGITTSLLKLDLEELHCHNNTTLQLSHISHMTRLQYLRLGNNKNINVSTLTQLVSLGCENGDVKDIDLMHLTNLTKLDCGSCFITDRSVSRLYQLKNLWCGSLSFISNIALRDKCLSFISFDSNNWLTSEALVSSNLEWLYMGQNKNLRDRHLLRHPLTRLGIGSNKFITMFSLDRLSKLERLYINPNTCSKDVRTHIEQLRNKNIHVILHYD